MPFGASVHYEPSSPKDIEALRKFGLSVKESVFMGYVLKHGGGWTDDVDILDGIELTNAQSN